MVSLHDIDGLPDDAVISAGRPIPKLLAAEAIGGFRLRVTWVRDGGRPETEEIDVAPAIFDHRGFIRLSTNPALFERVAVDEDGNFIFWPDGSVMDAHWIDRHSKI